MLTVLRTAEEPLSPHAVSAELTTHDRLAYNTILTVLRRLHDKGLIDRRKEGRAYAYSPRSAKAEDVAREMRDLLDRTTARAETLAAFAGALGEDDAAVLRAALRRKRRGP